MDGLHERQRRTDPIPLDEDAELYPDAPSCEKQTCDTVVIGSGIAGLSVAYEFASSARRSIVIDRGPIAGGMTSRTTAHLAPICDDGLSTLINLRAKKPRGSSSKARRQPLRASRRSSTLTGFRAISGGSTPFCFRRMGVEPKERPGSDDQRIRCGTKGRGGGGTREGVPLKGFEKSAGPALSEPGDLPSAEISAWSCGRDPRLRRPLFANSPVVDIEIARKAACASQRRAV